jgi:hypothetical protein
MTFGADWGWGADRDTCRAIFDAFVAQGGNFFDTANLYTGGASEKLLGEFVATDRDAAVIATKYTNALPGGSNPNAAGNHRKSMVQSLEASLKRLGTDRVDLFWVHAWDFLTSCEEVMRGLDDLVRQGKVLHVGISNAPAWIVARCNTLAELRGWTPFAGLQLEYSLLERTAERELMPMARDFGLTVLACRRSPPVCLPASTPPAPKPATEGSTKPGCARRAASARPGSFACWARLPPRSAPRRARWRWPGSAPRAPCPCWAPAPPRSCRIIWAAWTWPSVLTTSPGWTLSARRRSAFRMNS